MTTRSTDSVARFQHPFTLDGAERILSPGEYLVVTEEDSIEGLSFLAYRRVSTFIFLPQRSSVSDLAKLGDASSAEMLTIDPKDLERALTADAAMPRAL